jgi:predicted ATPase
MEALAQLLDDAPTRLVTLTGPPGIGKTRLAVAAAAAHAEATGRTAAFVDLVPVRDPNMVIVELARALDIDGRDRTDLVDRMAAAVAAQDRVVVLDNCEHLLAAAPSLGRVLAVCQGLRVLATSREPLRLSAEQEFPVPPLLMPAVGDVTDLVAVAANPSVALLVDRARRVHPRFALTEHNAASVVAACVRLEGLPLALELAAARLKVLSPGELAFRLGHRMELLASRSHDVPARHRALRSAITWSHDLLGSAERALFRRLSVFVGGWTLVDVERVCAAPTDDVLAVVESLLDKNMIRRVSRDDETAEFSMLESLREYAAEQLVLQGEAEQIRARHAAHYTELAVQYEATFGLPEERTSWLPIARHHANLRAALEHCLAEGQHGPARQLATALGWYCYTRGDLREGQDLVDQVLTLTAERDIARDTSEGFALRPPSSRLFIIGPSGRTHSGTRGPSDRPPPPAAPRSDRFPDRLATPKVAGQMRYLLMWSGRLTVPRPPRTCHNVTDPGPQEDLRRCRDCARHRWPLRGSSRSRRHEQAASIQPAVAHVEGRPVVLVQDEVSAPSAPGDGLAMLERQLGRDAL